MEQDEDYSSNAEERPREKILVAWWRKARRFWRPIVGSLVAFGVLGAVGSHVVDAAWSWVVKRFASTPPLVVSVREDPHGGADGFTLAAGTSTGLDAKLRRAANCDSLMTTAKRAGAVDVGHVVDDLTVQGTRANVSIVSMRARILRRDRPLDGASIRCASAGAQDAIGVMFNLDERNSPARTIADFNANRPGGPYFVHGKIVSLGPSEVQPFEVVGVSRSHYVEWEILADVVIDGKTRTLTITNNGKSFRATGPSPTPVGYDRYYEYRWYTQHPSMYVGTQAPHSG
jgi:hypothetical protein